MKYANRAPIDNDSPLQRLMETIRYEPEKALPFWCVVGILIFIILLGGLHLILANTRAWQAADVKEASNRTGIATVEVMTSSRIHPGRVPNAIPQIAFGLRINGRLAMADVPNDARMTQVRIGDRVQVTYRVGKSGDIYIEDWRPLPH